MTDVEIQTVRAQRSSAFWSDQARVAQAHSPMASVLGQDMAARYAHLARNLYAACLADWLVLS